ncbi:MAG: hypothetical protein ACLTXL_05585 [Clostridia bacterium]
MKSSKKAVDAIAASIRRAKGDLSTPRRDGQWQDGEVYMQAIDHAMRADKQAILLVPEISLTPQLVQVFRRRFGRRAGVHPQPDDGSGASMAVEAGKGKPHPSYDRSALSSIYSLL